jgi:hypothetical protein
MAIQSKKWHALQNHVRSVGWFRIALVVTATALLPIIECAFVNILTGTSGDLRFWASIALAVTALLHAILLGLLIWGEATNPATNILDAIQLEQDNERFHEELQRRTNTSKMIRSAFDALNLQTCRIVGNQPEPIGAGLSTIMQHLTCELSSALGVTSDEFTVEVYFDRKAIPAPTVGGTGMIQAYLWSPRQISSDLPFRLGDKSPLEWGWLRNRPGQGDINTDKERFYADSQPHKDLYFYRFATVPIYQTCSTIQVGLLIVTSTQTTQFAPDILDTMQFMASLLSHYLAAHIRCFTEWQNSQKRKARAKKPAGNTTDLKPPPPPTSNLPPDGENPVVTPKSEACATVRSWSEPPEEITIDNCCPPYGFPTLYASYKDSNDYKMVTLHFCEDKWEGDGITVFYNCIILQGSIYHIDYQWGYPPCFTVENGTETICTITA